MDINYRIYKLRELMKNRGIDAYIVPTSDPHQSEYIADYYKTREYISGFTGSAGTVVITKNKSGLWTDSRYFLQAKKELANTEIKLYKMGVSGVENYDEFLKKEVGEFGKIGFDGTCFSLQDYRNLSEKLGSRMLISDIDFIGKIWEKRPKLPKNKVWIYDEKYVGESTLSKIEKIREKMNSNNCDYTFIGSPEDICYILNIRGDDIEYNPVVLSYMLIGNDKIYLCIDQDKLTKEVEDYLKKFNITVSSYDYIFKLIKSIPGKSRIYLDPERTNVKIYNSINSNVRITFGTNFSTNMKSIKNDIEIKNEKIAYIKDAVALVKFFNWVETGVSTGVLTEYIASDKLHDIRKKDKDFIEESFETISAYADNAAIVHYSPSKGNSKTLKNEGLFLVDSGAHYMQGTTDITRTISLGKLTEEEKIDYTLVLKSHIALATAIFKEGTNGQRLDMISKYPLWKAKKDFFHGTGHGVGFTLTVHEGPQRISFNDETIFKKNMTTSNEPGLYIEGKHGIRIENEVYVDICEENEFGKFFKFENLTYVPINTRPVVKEMLDGWEIKRINEYNKKCFDIISEYLDENDLEYLKKICEEI